MLDRVGVRERERCSLHAGVEVERFEQFFLVVCFGLKAELDEERDVATPF